MNELRRLIIKGSVAAGTLGVAMGAGLLMPTQALAAWPKQAFGEKKMDQALTALLGSSDTTESADIKIKAPEIAENGAVVPVTVTADMAGVESITIAAPNNPSPLVASFDLADGAHGYASTRIKMGKSGDVVAIVKANGKLYTGKKNVKVTIGGCGG
ncbi:thiosulfate oxidation carrier protein SoxY [Sedimenticola thiotaurini]|uniref:Sulfur oxidation protein SoxY n=1 Tax=Sedimenticola thiotaurini TaxID=1543721 RepID=A0A0F7K364_9GAMM|nr:thiosulfate oxidation carrier protein SoxY [Sedimenticola thiotaurini]AKH21645.1 sulfur oxidation protein SoxY [Sedimenticola thiotaurini]